MRDAEDKALNHGGSADAASANAKADAAKAAAAAKQAEAGSKQAGKALPKTSS